jgi:hypothetical protein
MQTRRPLDSRPDRQTHGSGDAAGLNPGPFHWAHRPESGGRVARKLLRRDSNISGVSAASPFEVGRPNYVVLSAAFDLGQAIAFCRQKLQRKLW